MTHSRVGLVLFVVAVASLAASGASVQSPGPSNPAVSHEASGNIVGTWHRAQSCDEMVAAFAAAGLLESHADWAIGQFYPSGPMPTAGDWCAGAAGPLEHSHFFTADGRFGSRDERGGQVDDGGYAVNGGILSFPSHATDFGYDGDILVGYGISGEVAAFRVLIPDPCAGACADAYAWALSAFASGPWQQVVQPSPTPAGSPSPGE
jgi:hypothetical protein